MEYHPLSIFIGENTYILIASIHFTSLLQEDKEDIWFQKKKLLTTLLTMEVKHKLYTPFEWSGYTSRKDNKISQPFPLLFPVVYSNVAQFPITSELVVSTCEKIIIYVISALTFQWLFPYMTITLHERKQLKLRFLSSNITKKIEVII